MPLTATPTPVHSVDLAAWFARHGRDLPWRRSRDPWAVLVAEVMLQQTQVSRVVDRWTRFLDRFPTVERCASAPVAAVIDEWSGLGYNRRAVHLHGAARAVADRFGGVFPRAVAELQGLPGVGPYTARAVMVFAYEAPEAVLDTNVARILARTGGRPLTRTEAQAAADLNLDVGDPWTWNQAMLDVGAGHCTAAEPRCEGCPLAPACAWLTSGRPEPDPAGATAGVSGRQSRFEGSDRQGRGRLVRALRSGAVPAHRLAEAMGWPGDEIRARTVAATLTADGLVVERDGLYRLAE